MNAASVLLSTVFLFADAAPPGGPAAEARFPPLRLPPGFRATLFACDPFIEYPSAVAAGPRAGSIFVAVDYMTGLGTEIVRRDEIRLLEDLDGDGYADRSTVHAAGFNSIEGLTYYSGTLYVMHAPFLTSLRDADGDGRAEERRDLLEGLGLTPEENPVRLHCANGVTAGHDGWLYLALGDHGCKVQRPEGDRLEVTGGGILRLRPDGRDLHLFAGGLRNIYDVALDAELNVFVRDNENDGGEYKIRLCHSFFGADHGYPYLYLERPAEALAPLADLGLGSSAGGLCYLETDFPAEYRGNLFFCEWGRAVMRAVPRREGSGFAPMKEIEFAAGAENDPYGFKPTDLAVQSDGALMVADWADGQRPKRGRGRIYRIAWSGEPARPAPEARAGADRERTIAEWIARLDAESRLERIAAQEALERSGTAGLAAVRESLRRRTIGTPGRLHGMWVLAHTGGESALGELLELAAGDPDPAVRVQAVRAAADLGDPAILRRRLETGPGDPTLPARFAALARRGDPQLFREVLVALGRLRWRETPLWLRDALAAPVSDSQSPETDPALDHAAMQALRRSENWPAVLALLDLPDGHPARAPALRAIADRAVPEVVEGLLERLRREPAAGRRRENAETLARVAKKYGPQPYWGYRPSARPAPTVVWERTADIAAALDRALGDPERTVRLGVLHALRREAVGTRLDTLSRWLREEFAEEPAGLILESLRDHPPAETRDLLESVVLEKRHSSAIRLRALERLTAEIDAPNEGRLSTLCAGLEDGPVLAEALRRTGRRQGLDPAPVILRRLGSPDAGVRAAALEVAAERKVSAAGETVGRLLEDREARVREAAARAAGRLGLREAAAPLLLLAREGDPAVRRASFASLGLLRAPGALPLALGSLADREAGASALECLGEVGGPEAAGAVVEIATRSPSAEVLPLAARILVRWMDQDAAKRPDLERDLARVQGESGALLAWRVIGPLSPEAAAGWLERLADGADGRPESADSAGWRTVIAEGIDAPLRLDPARPAAGAPGADRVWLARCELWLSAETAVEFRGASSGKLEVRLDRRVLHRRDEARAFRPDSDRFEAVLAEGRSLLLLQVSSPEGPPEIQLRFRRKSSTGERENLIQAALNRPGDAERGRKLFFDAGKLPCSKCHAIRGQGERLGPDLTGIGRRFSRMHLVESILEPGRAIAPSYETTVLVLKDGRVLTGVKVEETAEAVTLGDSEGRRNPIAKSSIREERREPLSIMPEGLERQLTADEFVDLIGFLVAQK